MPLRPALFLLMLWSAPAAWAQDPSACILAARAAGATLAPAPVAKARVDARCTVADPVQLVAVTIAPNRQVALPDRPILACQTASTLAAFIKDVIVPAVSRKPGGDLVMIGTGPGFECRTRNRQPGARLSSHGQGLAIDIATFHLAAGKTLTVGSIEAMPLVAELRASACGPFTTVLGPGSDAAHATHLHLDQEPRGRDGKSLYCR